MSGSSSQITTPVQRLKFRLLAEGMAVSPEARRAMSGERGDNPMTLADYASTSGIAMELAEQTWVNAPIQDYNPKLVDSPSLSLHREGNGFFLQDGEERHLVRPLPIPAYHDQLNAQGRHYTEYVITHTDRVRLSPIQGCGYACQFCDISYKLNYKLKPMDECIAALRRAITDETLPAHHILISGGVPKSEHWERQNRLYEEVAQAFPGISVDVMMVASPGQWDLQRMVKAGIHALSINLELYDFDTAKRYMPRKTRLTRDERLRFIESAVSLFGPGRVRSLLMVGLEPPAMTLAGVRELAMRGCDPVLSPFRPDSTTPLRNHPAPSAQTMEQVYHEAREIAERYGVGMCQ